MNPVQAGGHAIMPVRKFLSERRLSVAGLQILAFFLDACALFLAYKTSIPVTAHVIDTLHSSPLSSFYHTSSRHLATSFILSLGVLIAFLVSGHYTRRIPWWSQIQFILKVTLFALMIEGFSAYILKLYYSRALIMIYWALAFGFLIVSRIITEKIRMNSESWNLPMAIIGDIPTIIDTLFAIESDEGMGFDPRVVLLRDKQAEAFNREDLPARYSGIDIRDGIRGYADFIETHPYYYYIIAIDSFRGDKRDELLRLLSEKGIKFAIVPSISRTRIYQSKPVYFFGNDVMLLGAKEYGMTILEKLLKRTMDIAGSLAGIAVFGIPMLLIGLMLKAEGQRGTIFYGGERIGKGGRVFRCWKFRTMEPGSDRLLRDYLAAHPETQAYWDRYFKLPDDPRVRTRTAKFIRSSSLDELPQLWNVLKGDMSLAGPRPILPREVEAYGDHFHEYVSVKPGLTGLWQVSGRNGTSFRRRIAWDSWYVRNWSLWGDVVIILKTFFVVLRRSGAS